MTLKIAAHEPKPGDPGYHEPAEGETKEAEVVQFVSEKDYAADLRKRILEAYKPILELFNEANRAGFIVQATVQPGALGQEVSMVQLLKPF